MWPLIARTLLALAVLTPPTKEVISREGVLGRVVSAITGGKEKPSGGEIKAETTGAFLSPTTITSSRGGTTTPPTQTPKTPETRISSSLITSTLPGGTTPSETARITPSKMVEQPQVVASSPAVGSVPKPITGGEAGRVVPSAPAPTITPSAGAPTEVGRGIVPGFVPTGGSGIPVPPSPVKEIPAVPISQVIEQILRGEEKPTAEFPLPEPIEERGKPRPRRIEEVLSELIR